MDPIIILPIALAVAWAASRKKKSSKGTKPEPPQEPVVVIDPFEPEDPLDGPGGEEPWRPGGPDLPKPPPHDGPVGPKPFPGPSSGPKPPEIGDPSPTEIYPGTTTEDIEGHEHAAYGLFISSDCETVFVGERWFMDVFLPQARELVLGNPDAFHHSSGVMYELLVTSDPATEHDPETAVQSCVAAWGEFVYGAFTPLGTFSGWTDDPYDEYWDYIEWFGEEYPALDEALWGIFSALYDEADLAEVFDRDWPQDAIDADGDLDFEPTGT